MELWAVVKNGEPLQRIEEADPVPVGTEVVVKVTHCGVCHSDLHFWKGSYNLGGGKTLTLTDRGVSLPRAPGHEVLGEVVAVGPEAEGVQVGDSRVVYPWLGCGECWRCRAGEENLCDKPHAIGVIHHGGFGSHVKLPHPRYLLDHDGVDPALAATYACSGITVYSAIRKLGPLDPDRPVLLVGAGGLGHAAIAMLRAMGHEKTVVVDISDDKLEAARAAGASAVVSGRGDDVASRVVEAAGGPLLSAMDFVNNETTASMALSTLGRGGRLVLVGVAGGEIPLSLTSLIFLPRSIMGSVTGSIGDLRDVLDLAKAGKLSPTPVERMPRDKANEALEKLKSGAVTGRLVLESS